MPSVSSPYIVFQCSSAGAQGGISVILEGKAASGPFLPLDIFIKEFSTPSSYFRGENRSGLTSEFKNL